MKLEEKHREFAVKCFARFMIPSKVAQALIEEFPQPPTPPELPSFEEEKEGIVYQFKKDEYIELKLSEVRKRYAEDGGYIKAENKLSRVKKRFLEAFENDLIRNGKKNLMKDAINYWTSIT